MAHPNTVSDTPASRSAAVTRRSRNPTTPGDLSDKVGNGMTTFTQQSRFLQNRW
jgi:hypothetical protein